MTHLNSRLAAAALGLSVVTGSALSLAQQPSPAEKVGEVLDETGRAIKRGVQGAGATVRDGFARTRTSVQNMEVVSRVYSRLHWDKSLTTATLELEVQAGGIAVLRGVVADSTAKTKAVTLAADTVGVTRVVDQLSIAPPTRIIPGSPDPIPAPAR
ncbi:BON domain-containing protein [Singulisphaera acidiphila]|uniref:Putative phospholipid-binding protein n=1 Tax=Singulisphaera acidiphila (strain ATCC BAA-1392 / DSM 18658 / VKM B-2454 / MOB10) TaxID=886293 RepID=L0DJF6_SINAD|nr:BON domain-containing protein [Singulisphaera acidiphila]AGA29519.1 putative phospholipid-binding protein [Singulisphaera acidiphila DSM 18658]